MSDGALKVMLVAVEPSGDAIGAALLHELKELTPSASFMGCGGPLMEDAGLKGLFPIERFSVMGATDLLFVAMLAMRRARELAEKAAAEKVDVAVFIDGWAFSRLAATRLRRLSPSTTAIKLAAPQVWASRPQRVKFVKRFFDGVLCLLPFEPPFFAREGIRAEFVGNPNFQAAWNEKGNASAFRARHHLGDAPLLAVLMGSRKREVTRLARPFQEAVEILAKEIPRLRIVSPLADSVAPLVRRLTKGWPGDPILVSADEKYDAMAAANAALAVSGTVSTELAINRTPMVVAYKVDPLTWMWAQAVKTTPYASIINVAEGRFVIPEFIQDECDGRVLAAAIEPLFNDPAAYVEQVEAFDVVLKELGVDGPSAARLAAQKVIEWAHSGKVRASVR